MLVPVATLIVLRHAKSDWTTGRADDERPLAPRGRRQAPLIGDWLAEHHPVIDRAVVSPTLRACETWSLVAERLPEPPVVEVDERIYEGWLHPVVAGLSPELDVVAVVGHNPDLEDLVEELTGTRVRMRTAEVAVIELEAWDAPEGRLVTSGRPPEDSDA